MKSIRSFLKFYRLFCNLNKLKCFVTTCLLLGLSISLYSQEFKVTKNLKDFDQYMGKILNDWNIAGAGVGIVYKDKLVLAKGYGFRGYENRLPVTPNTLFQIASNTKLFTTVSIGMLVAQGKLEWDKPVKNYVPSIEFYNDDLNRSVTIRDMLAHRTGISRHDLIWYKSDFTRKDLFERLIYLEPSQPLRQGFLYNNLMYVSAGYIVELLSSDPWEDFVQKNIFNPLEMVHTVFTVSEMEKNPDHAIPFNEKRDTTILYRIPYYEDAQAVGPAGAIISSVQDMSHWLIALMNSGKYNGKQVIPEKVINATLEPTVALPNTDLENKGYKEILNRTYCMGRNTASYRGHFLTYHGGDLDGFHSQVSMMPYDSIGVVVFVIGDQGWPLYNIISYNIYERLLGMNQTPWSERILKEVKEGKQLGKEGRGKAGADHVAGTQPSHPLADYAGQYENPAYGIINISLQDTALQFEFHHIVLPLKHYHYDRFDTPDDELYGLYSPNFVSDPQGEINSLLIALDESGQNTFTKKTDASLSDPEVLNKYVGKYEFAGSFMNIELVDKSLFLVIPGQPRYQLIPVKPNLFRAKGFEDMHFEFVIENNKITAFKQIDPSGEYTVKKAE